MPRQNTGEPTGRPTLLTPEVQAIIVREIERGQYFVHACAVADIDRSTGDNWLAWGAAGKEPWVGFFRACSKAEAVAAGRALDRARNGEGGESWWLERRFPYMYGRSVQVQQDGGKTATPIPDELYSMTLEQLRAVGAVEEEEGPSAEQHAAAGHLRVVKTL